LTLLEHNEYGGGNVRKINLISFDDGFRFPVAIAPL